MENRKVNSKSFKEQSAYCNFLKRENLQISVPRFLELIVHETRLDHLHLIYSSFIECITNQKEILSQRERLRTKIKTVLLEINLNESNLQECHQELLTCLEKSESESVTIPDQGTGKLPSGEAYFLVVDPSPNTSSAWVKKVKVFYGEDKEYTKTTEKAAIVVRRSRIMYPKNWTNF